MDAPRQWPMPAPPHGYTRWEFWSDGGRERMYLVALMEKVSEGNVELTQEVWDDLPEPVQEGFFKLALLPDIAHLEGVGRRDSGNWLYLAPQLTPKKIANKTFSKWYDNLPRVKESDDVQQHNQ